MKRYREILSTLFKFGGPAAELIGRCRVGRLGAGVALQANAGRYDLGEFLGPFVTRQIDVCYLGQVGVPSLLSLRRASVAKNRSPLSPQGRHPMYRQPDDEGVPSSMRANAVPTPLSLKKTTSANSNTSANQGAGLSQGPP